VVGSSTRGPAIGSAQMDAPALHAPGGTGQAAALIASTSVAANK